MSTPARTNAGAVQSILGLNYDKKRRPDLTPFINSASDVVDQVLALSRGKSRVKALGGLTATTLANIEMWVAAHLYVVSDPLYMSRSTEGASGAFQRAPAKDGLASSDYGKTAMDIDWSGCLTNINMKQFASALGMGHHPDQGRPGDGSLDAGD